MIPSITSFMQPTSSTTPIAPGASDIGNLPLPLVPAFMLGGLTPAPIQAPQLQVAEEGTLPESSDPEQLMQLLLDPALMPPAATPSLPTITTPSLPTPTQPQQLPPTQLSVVSKLPAALGQVIRQTEMPTTVQPATQAATTVTPTELAQPYKLRTPQDARAASQQVLAMMQAQPDEPLAKMLPPQVVAQVQPQIAVNQAETTMTAKTSLPLTLPEGAQEKAAALREALGERLQMQVDQRSQKATIRLDPPNLGKLDISLHYEGGKLQVQIQAAQPEVYRALQQVSQELRGALSEQNQVAVNVQVSQQQQQGEQRHAHRQQPAEDAVLSNNIAEVTEEQRHRDLSILTTV